MADIDYNVIKPVESLPTIQGLEPAKRRQERKRQQNSPGTQHREEPETESEGTLEPEAPRNDDDLHSIDYCA